MSAEDSELPQAVSGVSKDEFKQWVRDFRDMDEEISAAGKALSQLRKSRKDLLDNIHEWMRMNKVPHVRLNKQGRRIERFVDHKPVPVNQRYVQSCLADIMQLDAQAAKEVASAIYSDRPTQEREIIKCVDPPKKRRRVEPVAE